MLGNYITFTPVCLESQLEYNRCMSEPQDKTTQEEFKINGRDLVDKVKELVKQGNVRRIIVKDRDGKTLVELPVTIGVVGVVFAPVLAGLGAIAALVAECTIIVERRAD